MTDSTTTTIASKDLREALVSGRSRGGFTKGCSQKLRTQGDIQDFTQLSFISTNVF